MYVFYRKEVDDIKLEHYNFWNGVHKEFKYKDCECGGKMGVIQLGSCFVYACEHCPNTMNLCDKDFADSKNRRATAYEDNKPRVRCSKK